MTPFSYRWVNALLGTLTVPAIAALAWLLTRDRRITLVATFLFAADGLFIVDSRLALTNTSLVLFGVLAQVAFLLAPEYRGGRRWGLLALAGIGFGASAAVKWNGLGFLAGAIGAWGLAWLTRCARAKVETDVGGAKPAPATAPAASPVEDAGPVERLGSLPLVAAVLALAVVPCLTYWLVWQPHLRIYPQRTFWQWQVEMLHAHEATGGEDAHRYCSRWYTWPFLQRPVAYYYVEDVPAKAPGERPQVLRDIHAIANPAVCWSATIAVLGLAGTLVWTGAASAWRRRRRPRLEPPAAAKSSPLARARDAWARLVRFWADVGPRDAGTWLAVYLLGNYVANLLPWIGIKRCAFLYHYMEAYVFAILILALLIEQWRDAGNSLSWQRKAGATWGLGDVVEGVVLGLVGGAFICWFPIFVGLPISGDVFYSRLMLFQSWI